MCLGLLYLFVSKYCFCVQGDEWFCSSKIEGDYDHQAMQRRLQLSHGIQLQHARSFTRPYSVGLRCHLHGAKVLLQLLRGLLKTSASPVEGLHHCTSSTASTLIFRGFTPTCTHTHTHTSIICKNSHVGSCKTVWGCITAWRHIPVCIRGAHAQTHTHTHTQTKWGIK